MFKFKKEERLCAKKDLDNLYNSGKHKLRYPLKLYWNYTSFETGTFPARIVITVPKRLFKKAVHRNRIKRQIREVYRLNKHLLYQFLEKKNVQADIGILYIGKEFCTSNQIKVQLLKLFENITAETQAS